MEEKLVKFQILIKEDPGMLEEVIGLETPEEVQSFFQARGIEFSLDEIVSLKESLLKYMENGELDEEDLESVAGGIAPAVVFGAISATASCVTATHTVTRGRW